VNRNKKIQTTTKGPSRKQAIVPIIKKHVNLIMNKANIYISLINSLLKNAKSNICLEFIWSCSGRVSIATNNISASSDLSIIKKYFKSIDRINNNKMLLL